MAADLSEENWADIVSGSQSAIDVMNTTNYIVEGGSPSSSIAFESPRSPDLSDEKWEAIQHGAQAVIDEMNTMHDLEGIPYADLYDGLGDGARDLIDAAGVQPNAYAGSPSRFTAFGSPISPEKFQPTKLVYAELEAQYEAIIKQIRSSPMKEYGPDVGLLEKEKEPEGAVASGLSDSVASRSHQSPGKGVGSPVQVILEDAVQKEELNIAKKRDCELLMDTYKKLINGSPKDKERLEKEQINFVEYILSVGRRRYLLLLAFKLADLMDLKDDDETDYTPMMKLFVAGYFYPERFRRRQTHSEGQKFGAEWLKQVDILMEHAIAANPTLPKKEAFLGSVNEAWQRAKKHHKEVIREIAEESLRAEDDLLAEKERWGDRWMHQLNILIATTILNTKISTKGRRVRLVAGKPEDLDTSNVMNINTVVEWDRFQQVNWENMDDEEKEAFYLTAMELINARFNHNWRANVKLALETLDQNNGLEHLERVLKMIGLVARVDIERFEPELGAIIVFIHRYIQEQRGKTLPPLITHHGQLVEVGISMEEDLIRELVRDHLALIALTAEGRTDRKTIGAFMEYAFSKGNDYYLEMLFMSMAWPEDALHIDHMYDTIMRMHDYILLK